MIDFPIINKILVALVNAISLWLGFWVFSANRKDKKNQIFLLWVISTSLWISLYYLVTSSMSNPQRALIFAKLGHGAVSVFYIPFYLFFIHFLNLEKKLRILTVFIVLVAMGLFFLSTFTNLIVEGIEMHGMGVNIILGKGAIMFYLMAILLSVLVFSLLLKKFFNSLKNERTKIQYFLIGVFSWISLNFIFNMVMPILEGKNVYYYAQVGNYSIILLLGFTAYAIMKRKLFGIRVVLTQILVVVMAILLIANFLTSQSSFEYAWKGALVVAFVIFGWLLVKSVIREIEQREKLDKLATQLATVNVRLEGAYRKLQKLDKAKSEFVSIASHQLRTPLTAIKGYISMLLDEDYGRISKKAKEPLFNVYTSNERLIRLVNSLLNISRIEAGKIKLNPAELSLEKMLKDIYNDFKEKAKKKKLTFILEKPKGKIPQIKADEMKLREVISNLVDNAIKYTAKGNVAIKLEKKKKTVVISIEDTGEGLTKDELSKLFQSFSRAGAGRRFWVEGAGLGLYVARKFIKMHKGKIYAESAGKNKGSTFYVELPLK